MGRALWDSGIAQWVEHYGIAGQLGGRALWDSGIAQWAEHYGKAGELSGQSTMG